MAETQTYESKLINGLLTAVNLTTYGIEKTGTYDPGDVIDGAGVLVCEITNRQQAYPGQPIYFVSVRLMGLTYASVDPDQSIIEQIYADTMKSVQGWTAATLTTTVGMNIDGILPITTAAIRSDGKDHIAVVDFRLAMSGVTF